MRIDHTRFGSIEFDEARAIHIPAGLFGFPTETRFILLEPQEGRIVAWLQSLVSPELAFPVVGSALFGATYPSPDLRTLARKAKLAASNEDELTALVVVAVRNGGRIANLLAPIIVNIGTRVAAQVILDAEKYTADAPFEMHRVTAVAPVVVREPSTPAQQAQAT